MALPGNGTILAVDPRREELARAGRARRSWRWSRWTCKPRDIVTAEAIDNAFALDMAMGGSTNTVLHTLALAHEAGVDYPIERLNEVAERVPNICKVSPSSQLPRRGRGPGRRRQRDPVGAVQAAGHAARWTR